MDVQDAKGNHVDQPGRLLSQLKVPPSLPHPPTHTTHIHPSHHLMNTYTPQHWHLHALGSSL